MTILHVQSRDLSSPSFKLLTYCRLLHCQWDLALTPRMTSCLLLWNEELPSGWNDKKTVFWKCRFLTVENICVFHTPVCRKCTKSASPFLHFYHMFAEYIERVKFLCVLCYNDMCSIFNCIIEQINEWMNEWMNAFVNFKPLQRSKNVCNMRKFRSAVTKVWLQVSSESAGDDLFVTLKDCSTSYMCFLTVRNQSCK